MNEIAGRLGRAGERVGAGLPTLSGGRPVEPDLSLDRIMAIHVVR
jgi:hypothetical protein